MKNFDRTYTLIMNTIFLLNLIHWILRSLLSLSAIFLTLGNFRESSTFYRPCFAATLLIGETFSLQNQVMLYVIVEKILCRTRSTKGL